MILFQEKNHYEDIMKDKVLPEIKQAETIYKELEMKRQVSNYKILLVINMKRDKNIIMSNAISLYIYVCMQVNYCSWIHFF